ncbi:hypothetical protein CLAFUW4_06553 [Fulvia fulva]|uniref:Uncharacterized protein n=1 Tax=Passalora fulva TaxID=5499 RepID=A0A9Q8PBI4_PASFU|nr:uncharacterized protein CLAFUR5_06699 [Fulvia fulva]KAK4622027.1 hypothetical protein CLAFUR4_06561 [Fulvia fulva]KAK4623111.1 hypothetical protein CLAFUR0_06557 [Fulvia fulva]UJO19431.1 hypothetical protein CLAFUR5_06699 [Fulvia fulva]WPV15851.1 hypothetical protein CLAFUW4_06553 [Fulvia fulva]WPV30977.1 hypothetical protein CLAFUW7_06552 [Fulvia fulva]
MAQQLVPVTEMTDSHWHAWSKAHPRLDPSRQPCGVNSILYMLGHLCIRLEKKGHHVGATNNAVWRTGDDSLDGTPGLRRIKAKLATFHETLLGELVEDSMQEWHRARHAANNNHNPNPIGTDAGSELHAALYKMQLKNQRLKQQIKYQHMLRKEWAGEADTKIHKLEDELSAQRQAAAEKVEVLEDMLLQAKVAAVSMQASLSIIMVPSLRGTAGASRAYQIQLDARLGRQAEEEVKMRGGLKAPSYISRDQSDTSSLSSLSSASDELAPHTLQEITIREAVSSPTQFTKGEDCDIDLWSDGRRPLHVKHQALFEAGQRRKQREFDEYCKREFGVYEGQETDEGEDSDDSSLEEYAPESLGGVTQTRSRTAIRGVVPPARATSTIKQGDNEEWSTCRQEDHMKKGEQRLDTEIVKQQEEAKHLDREPPAARTQLMAREQVERYDRLAAAIQRHDASLDAMKKMKAW